MPPKNLDNCNLRFYYKKDDESFEEIMQRVEDVTDKITLPFFDDDIEFNIPVAIVDVIFNNPATIVFWTDNTKTVVKCGKDETFDPEKGLAMAIAKKFYGNKGSYNNEFKRWMPE